MGRVVGTAYQVTKSNCLLTVRLFAGNRDNGRVSRIVITSPPEYPREQLALRINNIRKMCRRKSQLFIGLLPHACGCDAKAKHNVIKFGKQRESGFTYKLRLV